MSLQKDKVNFIWSAVFIALALLISMSAVLIIFISGSAAAGKLKVGCIFNGSTADTGWSKNNYDGVSAACLANGAQLLIKENVPEKYEACAAAVKSLALDGCKIIFLTSFGYGYDVEKLISEYPNIAFFANGSYLHGENITYYFGRMYQGRYLSGIAAGLSTKSGIIGYVAAMPNSEVIRGIDAFALGVRSVNPLAGIHVRYTGSWDDKAAEEQALSELIKAGADVVTYHQNRENIPEAADKAGLDFIGYHTMSGEYSDRLLMCVECRWDIIYDKVIHDYMRSRIDFGGEYWLGIQEGAIELTKLSPLVPAEASERIESVRAAIAEGAEIFSGMICDTEGNVRCLPDERMSDEVIMNGIDWYVEGVTVDG